MIKPILIPTDNKPSKGDVFNCPELKKHKLMIFGSFELDYVAICKKFDIILIDTEAEIVEGDCCLCNDKMSIYDKDEYFIGTCKSIENNWINVIEGQGENPNCTYKIISSTNKSHTKVIRQDNLPTEYTKGGGIVSIPQLSNASKLLLINYYNEHKCMPESVEIEKMRTNPEEPEFYAIYSEIKLNTQGEIDITIPEVEEKLYTEEEVIDMLQDYYDSIEKVGTELIFPDSIKGWFNSKKK